MYTCFSKGHLGPCTWANPPRWPGIWFRKKALSQIKLRGSRVNPNKVVRLVCTSVYCCGLRFSLKGKLPMGFVETHAKTNQYTTTDSRPNTTCPDTPPDLVTLSLRASASGRSSLPFGSHRRCFEEDAAWTNRQGF